MAVIPSPPREARRANISLQPTPPAAARLSVKPLAVNLITGTVYERVTILLFLVVLIQHDFWPILRAPCDGLRVVDVRRHHGEAHAHENLSVRGDLARHVRRASVTPAERGPGAEYSQEGEGAEGGPAGLHERGVDLGSHGGASQVQGEGEHGACHAQGLAGHAHRGERPRGDSVVRGPHRSHDRVRVG